uniref:Uncharacterized protein n=1 Tax=Anopheles darlingi TaxID=43151 RepID=A0A2M4DCL3_ANODA
MFARDACLFLLFLHFFLLLMLVGRFVLLMLRYATAGKRLMQTVVVLLHLFLSHCGAVIVVFCRPAAVLHHSLAESQDDRAERAFLFTHERAPAYLRWISLWGHLKARFHHGFVPTDHARSPETRRQK